MKIGLDLSVIQTPHRMRGIGSVAINFVKNIPPELKVEHTFVLFLYEKDQAEALSILDLEGLVYEVRTLQEPKRTNIKLPGKLKIVNSLINAGRTKWYGRFGDPRIENMSDLDSFVQFDQMQALPRSRKVTTALILYDLIPYIMEFDYLWTYKTARANQLPRRSAVKKALSRRQYLKKNKATTRRADKLIAISNQTKNDFVKYVGVDASKISVIHLGVEINHNVVATNKPKLERYVSTSWGYSPKHFDLTDKPFLLFVGGADPRRKLNDLVGAFNNLKAQGQDIRLALVGDTMLGPNAIPVVDVQKYLLASSYLEDIVFLGFVGEDQKDWLYQKALAFVFPSVYEGFGLPVLEAMQYGTPVITYKNSSIHEVADNSVLYATNSQTIMASVKRLIDEPSLQREYAKRGKQQSGKFKWSVTSKKIIDEFK